MPAAIPIVGAVAGLAGAKKQADATKSAANAAAQAAQFNPYSISGPFGDVSWMANRAYVTPGSGQQAAYQGLGNIFNQGLLGDQSGLTQFAQGLGGGTIPGLFGQAQDASASLPTGAFSQFQNQLFGLGGAANGLIGQLQGQGMPNVPGSIDYSQAQGFLGQAGNALGNIPMDVNGLVNDRLNLLRQQAAPQEEQAARALEQRLFSQGRLGTTGGAQNIEAFARGLGQADLGRQLAAQDLGMQLQAQNAGINQANAGIYGNLAGQAANQAGNQFQGQLNRAGLFSDIGAQNVAQLMQAIGLSGNIAGQGFESSLGMNELTNARAAQRMQNALGLFGFGQDVQNNYLNQSLQALRGQQSIDAGLRELVALGGNLGGTAANAGANQGQFLMQNSGSPTGAFLSQLGGGLFTGGMERFAPRQTTQPSGGFFPTLGSNFWEGPQ